MRVVIGAALWMFGVTSACADVMNGERLAQRWCTPCHAPSGQSGSAPGLAAIARNSEFTREKLAISILLFHPTVLQATMTRTEASDLADYISSISLGK
jgi:cytochrome c